MWTKSYSLKADDSFQIQPVVAANAPRQNHQYAEKDSGKD